ncbi:MULTISPECIES: hypothetical protein [Mesonia]|uniref:Uncharacterized protein n=1 Tax=Mesonia oceanica TaxID=2687242 RepID=A0AC61Y4A2_9FLAO|nr:MULTISPECIES: hypothetical protein [Mesonia]MAN28811.1 hypothetical protein [Mesonia sp.]MAQ40952.1 hypothetical protein [Mesonia sp.]VVU99305.1 hypothetical protein FVB9532_00557 [Mesonia oceanica]|tara:strand:+ start:515 stop:1087 length:573 start_codon:yes stop_codon:yes gene_type:complete
MIQLRILLAPLLAFISLQCFAQQYPEYAIDGNGFKSIFQDLESGNFNGTVNGILIVKDSDNQKSLLDFQGSYAKLEIEKDEYEVYDLSYKNYIGKTTSGKTEIKYQTYGSANSFGIDFKGEFYELSLIDGACDLIINGLEYSYEPEKSTEYLIIRINKEIELKNSYKSKTRKSIKLLPNSTLIFAIKRNK